MYHFLEMIATRCLARLENVVTQFQYSTILGIFCLEVILYLHFSFFLSQLQYFWQQFFVTGGLIYNMKCFLEIQEMEGKGAAVYLELIFL